MPLRKAIPCVGIIRVIIYPLAPTRYNNKNINVGVRQGCAMSPSLTRFNEKRRRLGVKEY